MTTYTIKTLFEGLDVAIQGDSETVITGINTIQQAISGQLTFLVNPQYKKFLVETQASAIILSHQDAAEFSNTETVLITANNPYFIYARVARFFDLKPKHKIGIHPSAVIGTNSQIPVSASIGAGVIIGDDVILGEDVVIAAGSYIGDSSQIGCNTTIEPNVTIAHHSMIGERVYIASNTVIGSDGFGNAKHQGKWYKVPQIGRVIIEDDVEIGANTAIDRGAIGDTIIHKGARLDNLIQVGHNVQIGENTAIAGCVGIAGSAVIGKNCLIGGGTGINGHITIADNVVITGMTAVTKSIKEPGIYSSGIGGLVSNLEWRKNSARVQRLEQLMQRVKELEAALSEFIAERKEI